MPNIKIHCQHTAYRFLSVHYLGSREHRTSCTKILHAKFVIDQVHSAPFKSFPLNVFLFAHFFTFNQNRVSISDSICNKPNVRLAIFLNMWKIQIYIDILITYVRSFIANKIYRLFSQVSKSWWFARTTSIFEVSFQICTIFESE